MLTAFGKKLRNIRLDKDLLLKDMADILKVSPSLVSAVETGKKSVPSTWVTTLVEKLNLDATQAVELQKLAKEASVNVKIDMRNSSQAQRNAALVFARSFNDLSDEKAKAIIDFLHDGGL